MTCLPPTAEQVSPFRAPTCLFPAQPIVKRNTTNLGFSKNFSVFGAGLIARHQKSELQLFLPSNQQTTTAFDRSENDLNAAAAAILAFGASGKPIVGSVARNLCELACTN